MTDLFVYVNYIPVTASTYIEQCKQVSA